MVKAASAIIGGLMLALVGSAYAKLPPPSEEAKAMAAEAKAKADHAAKVAAYEVCMAENRVATHYLKERGEKAQLPACENPK